MIPFRCPSVRPLLPSLGTLIPSYGVILLSFIRKLEFFFCSVSDPSN